MTLTIVNEDDCSTIDNRGTRITDREKLETKKREKLRSEKSTKKTIKDKYTYTTIWDSQQNRQRRMRIYLKDKDLIKVDT
jgi:hypothetical protein